MRKTRLLLSVLAIAMIWCAACASVDSDLSGNVCPHAPDYDVAFEQKMIEEIESLPPDSVLVRALIDCAVLRDQVRVCARVSPSDR
jgi:hypothetical protein